MTRAVRELVAAFELELERAVADVVDACFVAPARRAAAASPPGKTKAYNGPTCEPETTRPLLTQLSGVGRLEELKRRASTFRRKPWTKIEIEPTPAPPAARVVDVDARAGARQILEETLERIRAAPPVERHAFGAIVEVEGSWAAGRGLARVTRIKEGGGFYVIQPIMPDGRPAKRQPYTVAGEEIFAGEVLLEEARAELALERRPRGRPPAVVADAVLLPPGLRNVG